MLFIPDSMPGQGIMCWLALPIKREIKKLMDLISVAGT